MGCGKLLVEGRPAEREQSRAVAEGQPLGSTLSPLFTLWRLLE